MLVQTPLLLRLFVGSAVLQLIILIPYFYTISNDEVGKRQDAFIITKSASQIRANELLPTITTPTTKNKGNKYYSEAEMQDFISRLPKMPNYKLQEVCDREGCLVHLHIGKNGGTSLDGLGKTLAKETNLHYEGARHFDWTRVEAMGNRTSVLTILRQPVQRSLSHFYFTKAGKAGPVGPKMKNATLQDYLDDKLFMLEERGIWQDGQAAVSWLTGTHIANWAGCPKGLVARKEAMALENHFMLLHLAANRLEQTTWFGILEDMDRSMELLQHALQINHSLSLSHSNKAKKQPPTPSFEEIEALKSLMPLDLWLYDYGKLLFEARWDAYKSASPIILPQRPPIPQELSCTSDRFNLTCISGPLKGTFVWNP